MSVAAENSRQWHTLSLFRACDRRIWIWKSIEIGANRKRRRVLRGILGFTLIVTAARLVPESFGDFRRITIQTGNNRVSTKFGRVRLTPAEHLSFAVFIYTIRVIRSRRSPQWCPVGIHISDDTQGASLQAEGIVCTFCRKVDSNCKIWTTNWFG